MRYRELFEDRAFGRAKKAVDKLSDEARRAVTDWQFSNWRTGAMARAFQDNDEIAQDIERVFAPIRETLPPVVRLYRGLRQREEGYEEPILTSWTTKPDVAKVFAGRGVMDVDHKGIGRLKARRSRVYSMGEIDATVARYEKHGVARLGGYTYIRNKEYPKYYDIYRGPLTNLDPLTDGDNLRKELLSIRDSAIEQNEEMENKGEIIVADIPRERIVWIADDNFSQEYIVKRED